MNARVHFLLLCTLKYANAMVSVLIKIPIFTDSSAHSVVTVFLE